MFFPTLGKWFIVLIYILIPLLWLLFEAEAVPTETQRSVAENNLALIRSLRFLSNNTKIVKEIIRSVLGIMRLTVLTYFIGEKYHSLDKFMSKFHRKF